MNTTMRRLSVLLLVLMFAVSGMQKLAAFGDTETGQFTDVFGLPKSMAIALVFLAGLLEVGASILILNHEFNPGVNSKKLARIGVIALAVFTIAATLIFKVYPRFKMIQILANLSVLGGLMLYYGVLVES